MIWAWNTSLKETVSEETYWFVKEHSSRRPNYKPGLLPLSPILSRIIVQPRPKTKINPTKAMTLVLIAKEKTTNPKWWSPVVNIGRHCKDQHYVLPTKISFASYGCWCCCVSLFYSLFFPKCYCYLILTFICLFSGSIFCFFMQSFDFLLVSVHTIELGSVGVDFLLCL